MKIKIIISLVISLTSLLYIWTNLGFTNMWLAVPKQFYYWNLLLFAFTSFLILIFYGIRWKQLLDNQLKLKEAIFSGLLCLGGNMFLPLRGGEVLRIHYVQCNSPIPLIRLFSRIFVEKVIDFFSIAFIGLIALEFLSRKSLLFGVRELIVGNAIAVSIILFAILFLKYCQTSIIRLTRQFFITIKKQKVFESYIVSLIDDVNSAFTSLILVRPGFLTIFQWLILYVASYYFCGQFIGVNLSYAETLIVMVAGALSLMLPGAPSGIGTFHASIASAFLLIDKSPGEGLLFAAVIHILFFVMYGLPAMSIYLFWYFKRNQTFILKKHA
jgi:uncharacterized protein (TIRG00374 family)